MFTIGKKRKKMGKQLVWNVESQGLMHQVILHKNKISVDGNEPVKLKDLNAQKVNKVWAYTIPLGTMDSCTLYRSSYTGDSLVQNGIDCKTGQPYVEEKLPKWVWIFWILYILDFALIIQGAIGGALNAGEAAFTGTIALQRNLSTAAKVILSTVFWFVITILEIIIVCVVIGIRY